MVPGSARPCYWIQDRSQLSWRCRRGRGHGEPQTLLDDVGIEGGRSWPWQLQESKVRELCLRLVIIYCPREPGMLGGRPYVVQVVDDALLRCCGAVDAKFAQQN